MKPRHIKPGTLVEIFWHDAWGGTGWKPDEWWNEQEPFEIKTVGYVVNGTGKQLLISGHWSLVRDDLQGKGQPIAIPWGCIDKIRKVR